MRYLETLKESNKPLTSYEVTKRILEKYEGIERKSITKEFLRKKSPPVNSRLRTLQEMSILKNEGGKYSLDMIGVLFLYAREKFSKNREILEEYIKYFETHNFQDIPVEFRWQIYKLKQTEMIKNVFDYLEEVQENTRRVKRKIYLLTEYLHKLPDESIQMIQKEEIDIAILYQCYNPPKIEREEEKELFKKLIENPHRGIEFRFLSLRQRYPIYICRIDEKWALFALSSISTGMVDRNQAFCGSDIEFVTWCRNLLYHLWWEKDVIVLSIDDILKANSL